MKCHCCGEPVIDEENHRACAVGQIWSPLCPDCHNAGAHYEAGPPGYFLVCSAHLEATRAEAPS